MKTKDVHIVFVLLRSSYCILYVYSCLAATRMRNRLLELMGTDEVGMSDLAFVHKLRTKIWDEYEVKRVASLCAHPTRMR